MKHRRGTLLDVISDVFAESTSSFNPPLGVEKVEKIDSDVIRIQFLDDVDCDLLCREAIKRGYHVERGRFAPRIIWKGTIIARVGSRSDPAKRRSVFIYLIPFNRREMNAYREVAAIRHGILNPRTGRLNFERFLRYNLNVISLLESYRKIRYERLSKRLEFH